MNHVCLSAKLSQNSHQGYSAKNGGSYPCLDDFSPEIVLDWSEYKYDSVVDPVVARYYDATIGRFISPDTIVPNPANPQSLNRYSYCYNNPLKYIDPSGHLALPYPETVEEYGLEADDIYPIPDDPMESVIVETSDDACQRTVAMMQDLGEGRYDTGWVNVNDEYVFRETITVDEDSISLFYQFEIHGDYWDEVNSHQMRFGIRWGMFDLGTAEQLYNASHNWFPGGHDPYMGWMSGNDPDLAIIVNIWKDVSPGDTGFYSLEVDRASSASHRWADTYHCPPETQYHMVTGRHWDAHPMVPLTVPAASSLGMVSGFRLQ